LVDQRQAELDSWRRFESCVDGIGRFQSKWFVLIPRIQVDHEFLSPIRACPKFVGSHINPDRQTDQIKNLSDF